MFSTVIFVGVIILVTVLAISRIVGGTLVTVGGICLSLVSLMGSPSFWYIPCVFALIPLGFVWWFCKPSLAAALSVGPLVASAGLLRFVSGTWFLILAACLIAAFVFVLLALLNSHGWRIPLIISLAYEQGKNRDVSDEGPIERQGTLGPSCS